jgi:hypothetical protein
MEGRLEEQSESTTAKVRPTKTLRALFTDLTAVKLPNAVSTQNAYAKEFSVRNGDQ